MCYSKIKVKDMLLDHKFFTKRQRGQVLVLILLIVLIGLTIGLSITSRTLQDLRSTSVTDQSSRAFSAAEAGIEEALKSGLSSGTGAFSDNKSSFSYQAVAVGGGTVPFLFPDKIVKDNTQQIWLIEHDTSGNLVESPIYNGGTINVCWGDSTAMNDSTPAIEIGVVYKSGSSYGIAKGAYDPWSSRRSNNGFGADDTGVNNCQKGLAFKKAVNFSSLGVPGGVILEALRLRLLYNATPISLAVEPVGASLPSQGKVISSRGQSDAGIIRKVEVYKSWPSMPALFDYVLFSGSTTNPLSK